MVMLPEELTPGTLARYSPTTTRWYLATIRAVANDTVTLEYLDGFREDVDRCRVRSFHAFLRGREKVLSRAREDLCRALYGHEFGRLPQSRLQEMQALLRKHGLSFRPQTWPPGARIRIALDASFVPAARPAIDRELERLLPRWLEPNRLPPGSRDPLGFQSHAERLANEILPGLTVFTSRIGYYGFIAWAVRWLNEVALPPGASRRERFHRLERALALCEFIRHGQEDRSCPLLGQRSKTQILQSAVNDRFRVPKRILKNQESAGAFRLYSTSMESHGFTTQAAELAADGLLPVELTALGKDLANEFQKCVPTDLLDFAFSDKTKSRDTLRQWGQRLCFSTLGKKYRDVFLKGFLFGGERDAEVRYRTVRILFKRGLLRDNYEPLKRRNSPRPDAVAEEDLVGLEDESQDELEEAGLANRDVLLRFYGEKPTSENVLLQKAAVFELLSLAQTAIFAHALGAIESSGRAKVAALAESVVADKGFGRLWKVPFCRVAARAGSVRELEQALLETEEQATAAALGGALLARVKAEAAYGARMLDLADTPVKMLLDSVDPSKSLAQGYADLLQAMVTRHDQVSRNKNRQRWCYLDGGEIVKDDLRPLGYAWHAMRFPQLSSLCRDLGLTKKEVSNGR